MQIFHPFRKDIHLPFQNSYVCLKLIHTHPDRKKRTVDKYPVAVWYPGCRRSKILCFAQKIRNLSFFQYF